jgi:hypothetical protein
MKSWPVLVTLLFFTMIGAVARAQSQPAAPPPDPYSNGLGTDCAYENVFAGPSFSGGAKTSGASFTGGVTVGEYWARTFGKGVTASPQFELGIIGPLPAGKPMDGLAGFDFMFANRAPRRKIYPFFTGGYTRMFVTGNAANFGLGFDFGKSEYKRLVRIELKDYYLFTGPKQHVVSLRIGFGKFVAD